MKIPEAIYAGDCGVSKEATAPLLVEDQKSEPNASIDSVLSRVWRLWETGRNLLDRARDLLQNLNCRSRVRDRPQENCATSGSGESSLAEIQTKPARPQEKLLEEELIPVEIANNGYISLTSKEDLKPDNIYIFGEYISEYQLKVEQITGKNYPMAHKVAQEWLKTAEEKAMQAGEDPEEGGSFTACHSVMKGIARTLQSPPENDHFFRVITPSPEALALDLVESYQTRIFICKDKNDRVQGMMKLCVENTQVCVSQMSTNPKNIRSWVNENESEKVEGAGSTLMRMAEKLTLDLERDELYLFALRESKPFYRKLNFAEKGNPSSPWMYKSVTQIESTFNPLQPLSA
jgi:hypothetical protein